MSPVLTAESVKGSGCRPIAVMADLAEPAETKLCALAAWRAVAPSLLRRAMRNAGMYATVPYIILITTGLAPHHAPHYAGSIQASADGDACRKEICNVAVEACMRTDLSLNPRASTEAEKKRYCGQFLPGCLTRSISPDVPWYAPETVARFLKCPS